MKPGSLLLVIVAITLVILLLIIGILSIVLLARRQKLKQELKETQLQSRINDVNFAALRSQMNPHFIFNCLNSIKLYTEQNNSEAASEYLSKFAQLIRHTLDNARREKVLLQEEIEHLQLYLQLEAMRFKNKLNYSFWVDENVDTEFIEIPPMLVQPYVENAIWHGIMPKKDGGKIEVHFAQNQHTDSLQITVQDDGIGRVKAAEIKSETTQNQKSYGTQITDERIALINEKYKLNAKVCTEDLYENNLPSGTLVTIKLPVK